MRPRIEVLHRLVKDGNVSENQGSSAAPEYKMEPSISAVTIHWTELLDWTTGLKFFPFLDKYLCFK